MNDLLLGQYINSPNSYSTNYALGQNYLESGYPSSAGTFFLRAAELTDNHEEAYFSLIKLYVCLNRLGGRVQSERSVLNCALQTIPEFPEAYYFLSKSYEQTSEWQEAYSITTLGLTIQFLYTGSRPITKLDEYPGDYALLFQKALSAYHLNKWKECRFLFRDLLHNYEMDQTHFQQSLWNSRHLGSGPDRIAMSFFNKANGQELTIPFTGSEKITRNYAQSYQDVTVLGLYDGQPGTYLEIGAADPYWGSNTALLEEFGWTGIGLENQQKFKDAFDKSARTNKMLLEDATQIDYKKFLDKHYSSKTINYLQLDCEPPSVTFAILLSLPLDEYKFGVITFEHDHFVDHTSTYRDKSRKYLQSHGYELLVNDVGPTDWYSYEDWWVHPDVVSAEQIKKFRRVDFRRVHCAKDLFAKFKD
jgi:tetratricopeptide (TPR) repeat protein